MVAIDGYSGSVVRAVRKSGALTFVRPGELRRAECSEIDLGTAEWRIPPEKMKMRRPHIVPLSAQAITILKDLHQYAGHARYLFPSTRSAVVGDESTSNQFSGYFCQKTAHKLFCWKRSALNRYFQLYR
jgi:integrase